MSEELGLHVTGFTECAHASGSPHGSTTSPHNDWRVSVFPAPMTTARAFSRPLALEVGRAIGRETRAKHNNATGGTLSWTGESSLYCMAPMINVCQDVRWGRCQEGNGECPFLNHEFGAMYSRGYQDDEGTGVLKALATPKHFDVFNGPGDGGGFGGDVTIGQRDKMTTHEPAFRGAFFKGGARSVMCSCRPHAPCPTTTTHQPCTPPPPPRITHTRRVLVWVVVWA